MSAGDTLYVCAGACDGSGSATFAQQINSDNQNIPSGTSWNNAITIAGYPGETVILRQASDALITLNSYNSGHTLEYIIFDNLVLDAALGGGALGAYGNPGGFQVQHIRFQNGEIKNAGAGRPEGPPGTQAQNVQLYDTVDFQILNSRIHDCAYSYGFYVSGTNMLIEGNDIYNNAGYAIQIQYAIGGHIVRKNRMYNNGFYRAVATITVSGGDNHQIYNNLIYGNNGGIQVRYNTSNGHFPNNTQIYHNTFYNNNGECVEIGGDFTHPTNTLVKNNMCALTGTVTNPGGIPSGIGADLQPNLITNSPGFVGGTDFHLSSGSPARNAVGCIGVVSTDYDNRSRPQESLCDYGAYEYFTGSGGPVATHIGITIQPGNGASNTALPSWTVAALDASNNVVTSYVGSTTIALGTNPGSAQLTGTLTRSFSQGLIAWCCDLQLNKIGVGYTYIATTSGFSPVTSNAFTVTGTAPGVPTGMAATPLP
jgi:parallel beta-helix repeat protein